MSDFDQELGDVFRAELGAALDSLAALLERLEDPDLARPAPILRDAMRTAHNVKGAARVVGFEAVAELAHALEDVLGALIDRFDPAVVTLLGPAVSRLEGFASGEADLAEAERLAAELREATPASDGGAASATVGEDASAPAGPGDRGAAAGGETMRVHVDRLDRLMAATGELLSARDRDRARSETLAELGERLGRLARRLDGAAAVEAAELARGVATLRRDSREGQRRLAFLADEVRESMRRVRMIPLEALAPVWRRVVREAALESGRSARLVTELGDAEIDRTILDAIRDPLVHLLRNAVSHGLETEEERRAAGKPPTGTVRIRASVAGGSVLVEVADDGRGIAPERIVRRATETGLLTAEQATELDETALLELVFLPGFSTAEVVDRVSGRGVGLDVVRGAIRRVGGTVALAPGSDLGGARVSLTLPASLVALRGLDVRCDRTRVVLPIDAVARTTRIRAEDLRSVDGGTAVSLGEGEPLHIRHLGRLLGVSGPTEVRGWLPVVVLRVGTRRLGVLVDEILGEGDHVTQPLPWCFSRVPGISGATILGDGSVAPVVDPLDLFARGRAGGEAEVVRRAPEGRRSRILVVDDSVTSRTLEKNILQAAGYEVVTAVDGLDGWRRLQEEEFELLVTDIEMPHLDGLELTRRVRAAERLAHLPVIVVSSLGSPEDVETGAQAGADEYLVKQRFDQRALLDAVARHVA